MSNSKSRKSRKKAPITWPLEIATPSATLLRDGDSVEGDGVKITMTEPKTICERAEEARLAKIEADRVADQKRAQEWYQISETFLHELLGEGADDVIATRDETGAYLICGHQFRVRQPYYIYGSSEEYPYGLESAEEAASIRCHQPPTLLFTMAQLGQWLENRRKETEPSQSPSPLETKPRLPWYTRLFNWINSLSLFD